MGGKPLNIVDSLIHEKFLSLRIIESLPMHDYLCLQVKPESQLSLVSVLFALRNIYVRRVTFIINDPKPIHLKQLTSPPAHLDSNDFPINDRDWAREGKDDDANEYPH